jgi:hypothetical protein
VLTYFFCPDSGRQEFTTLDDAWLAGSLLVCLRRELSDLYANIDDEDKLEEWLGKGLTAGIFQVCGG